MVFVHEKAQQISQREGNGRELSGKADDQYGPAGSGLLPKLQVAQWLPSPETVISPNAGQGPTIWPQYVDISG